jgi:rhodanese-related sulfurtransferase
MFDFLKKLFGGGPQINFRELVDNGAVIIDVRTRAEYQAGHIKGSLNIPLDQIEKSVKKIKARKKTVITCCRSGRRSGMAADILNRQGVEAVNGGGWSSLERKL